MSHPDPTPAVEPLSADRRRLAEEAWHHTEAVRRGFRAKFPDLDCDGAVAERIVRLMPRFDPSASALRIWAIRNAVHALRDLLRSEAPRGTARNGLVRVRADSRLVRRARTSYRPSPPSFEAEEYAARLMTGLSPMERDAVWGTLRDGMLLREVAARHNVHHSRICQIRESVLERLRQSHRAG